jgi:pimeloyl-ACP methyl ester carboxylesterase
VSLSAGVDSRADTRVSATAETLVEVMRGADTGVAAFLEGRLEVRGNLALSLRLNDLFGVETSDPRTPHASFVKADGIDTFYLEAGEGPTVVLLHGLGATNVSMLPTFWDLSADHRVIAPDLPGFGDSGKPLRSYNAHFYARWLKEFLSAVHIERAHLVGNSMGGRIAIEAALSYPEKVDRLVLLAPSPAFIRRREFVRLVGVLRPELALIPLPLPRRQVVAGLKRLFAKPSRMAPHRLEAAVDEFLRVFSTPKGRIAFFSAARQIYLEEPYGDKGFWDRLPTLTTPSLFVWGERDRLVPPKFSRHVARALPNATSVILEDCGHVPQFELPERTNELIRTFIDPQD